MSLDLTKNDMAWEKLFNKYNILKSIESSGSFLITAAQINEFREARLMTKFDQRINLPKLFSQNQLAILPITRSLTDMLTKKKKKISIPKNLPMD